MPRSLMIAMVMGVAGYPAVTVAVKVGDVPPPAQAVNQDGKTVNITDFYGTRPVVVFFYPKSFTPGCTKEVQAFRDARDKLNALDTLILGISQDEAATQRKFCDTYKLNYDLLADPGGKIAQAFGVPVNGAFNARWTVVIGRAGKVILLDQDVNADIIGHPAKVAEAVEKDWKSYVEQYTLLFNGKNLSGLLPMASEPNTWTVHDGLLVCSGKPTAYLRTLRPARDYRLLLEFQYTDVVGNSGVLVHANGEDKVWPQSIEANLNVNEMGKFYFINGAGGEPIGENPLGKVEVKPRTWNRYEIICRKDTIAVWLNGIKVNEARNVKPSEGRIALQSEGVPLQFRVWAIQPLPMDLLESHTKPTENPQN